MKRILILLSLLIASPAFAQVPVDTTSVQTLTNKTLSAPTITGASTLASPAFTGTPTFAGATSGTTGLAATAIASGTLTLPATTDTLVGKATTDILTNKTLTSPAISSAGFTMAGSGSGTATITVPAAAGTPTLILPTANTTGPAANPSTAGMALVATTAGVQSYAAMEAYFGISGNLGAMGSTAAATLLVGCVTATRAGHFVDLTCTDDFQTACTTAPQFNIRDNTGSTTGTIVACGNTAGQVVQAETLVFSAGDQICLVRTTNGGTCTVPTFDVIAHISYP